MQYIIRDAKGTMIAKVNAEIKNLILSSGDYSVTAHKTITLEGDQVFNMSGVRVFLWKGYTVEL